MAFNLYVMPITGAGTRNDPRQPKYTSTFQSFNWTMYDYGNETECLVGILDIDGATDSSLTGQADCIGLPSNLDNAVAGARSTVQSDLESVNIPGTWVQTTNTWRDVVLFVGGACQFAQRFQGLTANGSRWFTGGVTLNSTFNSLPAGIRSAIQSAAASFGFDTSGITGSSTLRQIIQSAAQQYVAAGMPLIMAGVSLYTV